MGEGEKGVDLLGTFRFGEDGKVIVELSYGQREFVKLLGLNGRRMTMRLDTLSDRVRNGLDNMEKQLVITSTPIVGGLNTKDFWLTDLGIQVWEQMGGGK